MNKTKKNNVRPKNVTVKQKKRNGSLYFKDYPEFRPNLTPREMFQLGSFGGTYWRPIYSRVTKTKYSNIHKKYPKTWWEGIPDEHLSSVHYNKDINKYKVKVGTSLEFWEGKNWITKYNPYGWVHWYCDFYMGKRSPDDKRQIKRWSSLAGTNGRFRKFLITQIVKKKGEYNDFTISPKIRQVLQHWGYKLNKNDYTSELESRKNKL